MALRHPEEVRHPDGRIEHPAVRFEATDLSFRGLLAVIIVLACATPVHLFFMHRFFDAEGRRQEVAKPVAYPLAPSDRLPVEPRLEQLDRTAGIETPKVYRREAAKEDVLHSYGPTDEKGFVHVPIEWAIKRAAEQLPVSQQQPERPAKDQGLLGAGESSSGRILRGQ